MPMATFWKKKQFWGSLIAIALLAYCVKDLRFSELDEIYQRMELVFFIPALLLIFVFVVAKAVRWRVLLGQHRQIPLWHLVPMYSAGQILNIVMPALTGQVGRMFLFAKKGGMHKTFVASTIILETLYDAISLVVFLMLTSVAFVFPSNYRTLSILIGCGTAAALVILYLVLNYRLALEEFGKRRLRDR